MIKAPADEAKARKWDGPYLDDEVVPADSWGNAFVYEYPPSKGARDFPNISSPGLDSEADTEDDVNNWRDIEQADGENASDVVSEADVSATPSSDD